MRTGSPPRGIGSDARQTRLNVAFTHAGLPALAVDAAPFDAVRRLPRGDVRARPRSARRPRGQRPGPLGSRRSRRRSTSVHGLRTCTGTCPRRALERLLSELRDGGDGRRARPAGGHAARLAGSISASATASRSRRSQASSEDRRSRRGEGVQRRAGCASPARVAQRPSGRVRARPRGRGRRRPRRARPAAWSTGRSWCGASSSSTWRRSTAGSRRSRRRRGRREHAQGEDRGPLARRRLAHPPPAAPAVASPAATVGDGPRPGGTTSRSTTSPTATTRTGVRCPLGAHVRRVEPARRPGLSHRAHPPQPHHPARGCPTSTATRAEA